MSADAKKILWVDDEIDRLQSHIIILQDRGFQITPVASGEDAIEEVKKTAFDLILLDEMMPGMDGLTTLEEIKKIRPHLPVVMVTKSEEEKIMNEAIGKNIADYVVKPVNPTQVVAVAKKILEAKKIQSSVFTRDYVQKFNGLRSRLYGPVSADDWIEIHSTLSRWDVELDKLTDEDLKASHRSQKKEFNIEFAKYVEKVYPDWVHNDTGPILSPQIMNKFVVPLLGGDKPVFFILIDGMRLDQWYTIEPMLAEDFEIATDFYYSILPTATPFARNAIFGGLFADDLNKVKPEIWGGGTADERSLNRYEDELLNQQFKRLRVKLQGEPKYFKIGDLKESDGFARKLSTYQKAPLFAVVFNFLDILAHGRSHSRVLQQIAPDESAFRSLMLSWFPHSTLYEIIRYAAQVGGTCVITSDHGTILSTRGTIAYGKRDTSTNLRYKYGDNLNCNPQESLLIKNPDEYRLPRLKLATTYLIAREDYYFVYPTNYAEYNRQFANSFQHGGISLEEMIVPIATLRPR